MKNSKKDDLTIILLESREIFIDFNFSHYVNRGVFIALFTQYFPELCENHRQILLRFLYTELRKVLNIQY